MLQFIGRGTKVQVEEGNDGNEEKERARIWKNSLKNSTKSMQHTLTNFRTPRLKIVKKK